MAIGDPYFDKVVLALPVVGVVKDVSVRLLKVDHFGGVSASGAQSKFDGTSCSFANSGNYLQVAGSEFDFGSGDLTFECWVYFSSTASGTIIQKRISNGSNTPVFIYLSAGTLYGRLTNSVLSSSSVSFGAVSPGVWYHIALIRSGGTLYSALGGVITATAAVSGALYSNTHPLTLGSDFTSAPTVASPLNGYIDDLRITKGIARYTSNFTPEQCKFYVAQLEGTVKDANGNFAQRLVRAHRRADGAIVSETLSNPSTGAFTLNCPDATKHYAVVHDSDAWITYLPFNGDNNSTIFPEWGGKAVTPYGNAKISTAQSKFGGASLYLDGTGDYLTLPVSNEFAFGTGDFTIESWVRLDSLGVERAIFDNRAAATGTGLYFYINASNQLTAYENNAAIVTGTGAALTATTWHHVALVKSDGTMTLYLNGVNVGSAASTYSITCPGFAVIGRKLGSTTNDYAGYIDDLKISKGKAQYVGNFIPASVPHFTEQAGDPYWNNVVLGCHFNSGETPTFRDVATGKTITAYGNAVISTAQSKFGGASAYFDGSGDYLSIGDSTDFDLTGPFSIEFWVYVVAFDTSGAMFIHQQSGGIEGGFEFYCGTNGSVKFDLNPSVNAVTAPAGTITIGSWIHLAVSWDGATYRIFKNGTIVGTAALATAPSNINGIIRIGNWVTDSAYDLNGYIDDLRITKGVARYTVVFTPPADPFSEVLGTWGQQNAMVFDHLTPV